MTNEPTLYRNRDGNTVYCMLHGLEMLIVNGEKSCPTCGPLTADERATEKRLLGKVA